MADTQTFQDRLREVWEQFERTHGRKLSQREVGKAIGASQTAMSALRNDVGRLPSAPNLEGLSDFFGVNQEWLLRGKGEKYPVASLTSEESELLLVFRALSPAGKAYILARAQEMYRDEYRQRPESRPTRQSPHGDDPADNLKFQ